jgi:hypothetical protein
MSSRIARSLQDVAQQLMEAAVHAGKVGPWSGQATRVANI